MIGKIMKVLFDLLCYDLQLLLSCLLSLYVSTFNQQVEEILPGCARNIH